MGDFDINISNWSFDFRGPYEIKYENIAWEDLSKEQRFNLTNERLENFDEPSPSVAWTNMSGAFATCTSTPKINVSDWALEKFTKLYEEG